MILEKKDTLQINFAELPEELIPIGEEVQSFLELRNTYHAAIREVSTKLEILDDEFQVKNDYNPIHHLEARVKSLESTFEKALRKGIKTDKESLKAITDIAGIRVICHYIDDLYRVANLLIKQDDIKLIRKKDYVANPKESGYRSLHLVVDIPVFLSQGTENIPVEIQLRTIAMDTWASLEHELRYKTKGELSDNEVEELKECAAAMWEVDERMQGIHRGILDEQL